MERTRTTAEGIEIREVGPDCLEQYGQISIAFRVESVLQVREVHGGLGGIALEEEGLEEPYLKDYDEFEDEGPTRWAKRFDVSNWGFFMAFDGDRPVGGAVLAYRSPGVHMLDGRDDMTVLWDLRVQPDRRRKGVGSMLFQHAVGWAHERKCRHFKVETQNVNVRACRFYAAQGCYLGGIQRHVYPEPVAHETMLLWYLDL